MERLFYLYIRNEQSNIDEEEMLWLVVLLAFVVVGLLLSVALRFGDVILECRFHFYSRRELDKLNNERELQIRSHALSDLHKLDCTKSGDDACTICFNAVNVSIEECNHRFCKACMVETIVKCGIICPLCRSPMEAFLSLPTESL